jgi:hypothetical protein
MLVFGWDRQRDLPSECVWICGEFTWGKGVQAEGVVVRGMLRTASAPIVTKDQRIRSCFRLMDSWGMRTLVLVLIMPGPERAWDFIVDEDAGWEDAVQRPRL